MDKIKLRVTEHGEKERMQTFLFAVAKTVKW
jgi:hypothetical protein